MGLSRAGILHAYHQIERRHRFLNEDSDRLHASSGTVRWIADTLSGADEERTEYDRLMWEAALKLRQAHDGIEREDLPNASRLLQTADQRIRLAETVWRRSVGDGVAGAKRGLGLFVVGASTVLARYVNPFLAGSMAVHGLFFLVVADTEAEVPAAAPSRVRTTAGSEKILTTIDPAAPSKDGASLEAQEIDRFFDEITEPAGPIAPPSSFAWESPTPLVQVPGAEDLEPLRKTPTIRSEEELIAEAQEFLKKWKANPDDPSLAAFDLGHFLLEASAAREKWESRRFASLIRRWEGRIETYRKAAGEKNGETEKVFVILSHAFTHDLVQYTAQLATLGDLFRGEGGNCEAQTLLLTAAVHAARLSPPPNQLFAVQSYKDHLRFAVYRPSADDKIWDPLTNERAALLRAPLFHPIPYILDAYLQGRGAESPVRRRDLLIADAEQVATKGHKTPPTNSPLQFRYGEGYYTQGAVSERVFLAWPYGEAGGTKGVSGDQTSGPIDKEEAELDRWIDQWNRTCEGARKLPYLVSEVGFARRYREEQDRRDLEKGLEAVGFGVLKSAFSPCDVEEIRRRWGSLDRFWGLDYKIRNRLEWWAKSYLVFEDRRVLNTYRAASFEGRIGLLAQEANRSLAEEADSLEMADLLTLMADPKVALEIPADHLVRMVVLIDRIDIKMGTLMDGSYWSADSGSRGYERGENERRQAGIDLAYRSVYQSHPRLRQLEERAASFRERLKHRPLAFLTLLGRLSPAQRRPFLEILLRLTMERGEWVESPLYPARPMRLRSGVDAFVYASIQQSPALKQLAELVADPRRVVVSWRTRETEALPEEVSTGPDIRERGRPAGTGEAEVIEVEIIESPGMEGHSTIDGRRRPYEMDAVHHLQWKTALGAYAPRRWLGHDTTQLLRENRGGRYDPFILAAINTIDAVSTWDGHGWPEFCGRYWNPAFLPIVRDLIRRGKVTCSFLKENRYR